MTSTTIKGGRAGLAVAGALLIGVVLLSRAPVAVAQPAAVESLIAEAVEHRRKGDNQRALPLLQRAYDLERSPRTAAQLGLAEAALGYWLSAERHLQEALTSTSNPWLVQHQAQIQQTLAKIQANIGELEVTGSPAGAEVMVNGQAAGKLPLGGPIRVPEGAAQVILRADGHEEGSTGTKVEGGKRTTVRLALAPLPGRTGASPSLNPVTRGSGPATPTSEPRLADGDQGDSATWVRPAAWVAAVAGVAALGVGAYGLNEQHKEGKAFDKLVTSEGGRCAERARNKGGTGCASIYNRMTAAKNLMMAGFAAGGVLVTAAVVGLIVAPDSGGSGGEDPGRGLSLQLGGASPQDASVSLGWKVNF